MPIGDCATNSPGCGVHERSHCWSERLTLDIIRADVRKVRSVDGLVVVDKPGGMTSHDVVARVRRFARTRRVGHGGTLDPMATGVLVVGVERATRLLTYVTGNEKSYLATVRLGESTVTDDAEGEVTARASVAAVTEELIRSVLNTFQGDIDQVPSSVSAIKVRGVRSYARVRGGEDVVLAARRVRIDKLVVTAIRDSVRGPATDDVRCLDIDIDVTCSSGTYIRAIARDLGAALGVGGHLTALRRTRVGGFSLAEAVSLDELSQRDDPITVPLAAAATRMFARREADEAESVVLSHGGSLTAQGRSGPYAVFAPDGRVLAIVSERDGRARPEVVLSPAGSAAVGAPVSSGEGD
jgi:tRNA pseudouridine55 synthase